MTETIIETRNLTKEFIRDEFHVVALKIMVGAVDPLAGASSRAGGK